MTSPLVNTKILHSQSYPNGKRTAFKCWQSNGQMEFQLARVVHVAYVNRNVLVAHVATERTRQIDTYTDINPWQACVYTDIGLRSDTLLLLLGVEPTTGWWRRGDQCLTTRLTHWPTNRKSQAGRNGRVGKHRTAKGKGCSPWNTGVKSKNFKARDLLTAGIIPAIRNWADRPVNLAVLSPVPVEGKAFCVWTKGAKCLLFCTEPNLTLDWFGEHRRGRSSTAYITDKSWNGFLYLDPIITVAGNSIFPTRAHLRYVLNNKLRNMCGRT